MEDDHHVRLLPRRALVHRPRSGWTFSHHPYVTFFKDREFIIWSSSVRDEDSAGQRVMISASGDFDRWTEPAVVVAPPLGPSGRPGVLTAAGFHEHEGVLIVYFGQYDEDGRNTRLGAVTSRDGQRWSEPVYLGLAVCPNESPRRLASGRLLLCGHTSFSTSDDPSGLGAWTLHGVYPPTLERIEDNPRTIGAIQTRAGWPVTLCEGSFLQTDDGVIRMLLRAAGPQFQGRLWQTESYDDGVTWSPPRQGDFPDNNAKFQFGRLADGRYFYTGCPDPRQPGRRLPLVLSLSTDGLLFSRHFIVADRPYGRAVEGRHKGGEYGYPHAVEHDGAIDIVTSRQKEAIEVYRVRLGDLDDPAR